MEVRCRRTRSPRGRRRSSADSRCSPRSVATRGGRTITEIAAACQLHRSITRRLLVSLDRTGFVVRDSHGRYHLGPALAALRTMPSPELRQVAEPVLTRLAVTLDATCTLVEIRGGAAVTTLVAEPPTDGPRFSYRVGSRDPVDLGAGGLAALASGAVRTDESERVARARAAGFVETFGELNPGVRGLAAPLPGWDVLASINVVTSRDDIGVRTVAALRDAAEEITASIGAVAGR